MISEIFKNKKRLFLMIFGMIFLVLGFGIGKQYTPKAEACGAECISDAGVCKYDDTTLGADHKICTINIGFGPKDTLSGTSQCSNGNRTCKQDNCLAPPPGNNGASCEIRRGLSSFFGCLDPELDATGIWDESKAKCISCLGKKEFFVCGTSGIGASITTNAGVCNGVGSDTGKFESACGASAACDEKSPGDSCSPPAGGTCDANGNCVAGAVCTYNNPTITLNPPSKTGTKGSTQTFTISVTNNNTATCANETFTLTGAIPGGWTNSISPTNTVTLASGGVMTRSFNVTSAATAAPGTYSDPPSVSGVGSLGGKTGKGLGTYVVSAGGYASFNNAGTWYSLKSDLNRTDCSFCAGANPPNNSCSNVGACQTNFGGSDAACIAFATCANDRDACKCPTAEICDNNIDDNGNGLVDCKDVGFCPVGATCGGGKTCDVASNCVAGGGGGCAAGTCGGAGGKQWCSGGVWTSCLPGRECLPATGACGIPGAVTIGSCTSCAPVSKSTGCEDRKSLGIIWAVVPPTSAATCAADADITTICGQEASAGSPSCQINLSNGTTCSCGGGGGPPPPPPPPSCSGSGMYRSPIIYCTVQELITAATGWILGLVSSIIILILVIGGIMYVTSTGDEERLRQAKNIIYYAILGLGIILISYALITEVKSILKIP